MNVQTILFGVFAVALVFSNELVPRMYALRYGGKFQTYALKELRPWVYAMSLGAFGALGIFGDAANAFVTGVLLISGAYMVAVRVYERFA